MAANIPRVTYDRVMLLDLNPRPDYPHVVCVSYANSGIPLTELENARFTREFRLSARDLPIYDEDGHVYFLLAKVESDCDARDQHRATQALNDFVTERKKAGLRLDKVPEAVVDGFKSRVQRRIPYVHHDDRAEHPAPRQTGRRKRPVVSSSDPEGLPTPPPLAARNLGLAGSITRRGRGGTASAKRGRRAGGSDNTVPPSAVMAPPPPPPPAKKQKAHAALTTLFDPDHTNVEVNVPVNNSDMTNSQGIVLATVDTPVVFDSSVYASFTTPQPTANSASATMPPPPRASPTAMHPPAPFRTSSSSPSPAGYEAERVQKSQSPNETNAISKILERLDALDRRIEKRHTRFVESLQYLISAADTTAKDVGEIRQSIHKVAKPLIDEELAKIASFPLATSDDVEEYLLKDPTLTHLTSR